MNRETSRVLILLIFVKYSFFLNWVMEMFWKKWGQRTQILTKDSAVFGIVSLEEKLSGIIWQRDYLFWGAN